MQSMFRLPWCNESPGDKIMEKSTLHKSRPLPVVEMPNFMNKIKRKRTDSPEPSSAQHAHVVKKWKGAHGEVKPSAVNGNAKPASDHACLGDAPRAASAEVLDARPKAQPARKESASKSKTSKPQQPTAKPDSTNTPATTTDSGMTAVQQAIEAQINYEILLKHNELRLIEQELAKCQVSLEQLRRCSLIPFPGTEGLNEDVSLGVGASLLPASGYTEPQYAAPWGVTDGPYTRHYAKWLISDVKFDPVSEKALAQQAQGYFGHGEGRTTRGSFTDYGSAHRGRTSRTSTGMLKLTPLGETPAPAPKVDPLLHKRSTDGKWVRLYCAQCGHSNFSNTQGFLNHCRIKHTQVFKSHDAAAIACGVPVDTNEVANPVPATEPASTPAAVPAVSFPIPTTPGIVHPLAAQAAPVAQAPEVHRDVNTAPLDESKPATPSSYVKSSSTPYLAARFQNSGLQGDFKEIVETARAKIDLDAIDLSDDDSADNSAAPTPVTTAPPHLARLPASAPLSKAPTARAGSKKGSQPSHARLPMSFPSPVKSEGDEHMLGSSVDLSPNTVESNPGLVSDHDDDDDDDADDAHSQPDLAIDDHVMVEDSSDVEGAQERSGSRQGLHGCFEKGEGSRNH
ncbi:retrograde transporter protein [Stemphylium lycopersici]|uniref:Retrograde transporter protein n=1 Tax=Stemphylium lycopersici TaxID=183478 RepID=A0A364MWJ0_STELY|nr:retrograde transporter protein [Stemphylium lycopersici]RAR05708.1 retrograde transporter protein [Stemphylium lycopersici]